MRNKVLRFTYNIASSADDEVRFPALCAVHLFDRLQMRNGIAIKLLTGLPSPDEGSQIVASFSQRQDVNFYCNKKYGGMLFRFKNTIATNTAILQLLQLDSIGTQYILLTNPIAAEFLTTDWDISEEKLVRQDLAKFVCSMSQDRDPEFYFSAKYYEVQKLKSELMNWEQTICQITGMSQMERKDRSVFGTSRFVDITLY